MSTHHLSTATPAVVSPRSTMNEPIVHQTTIDPGVLTKAPSVHPVISAGTL